jgi:hypothetical protein
MHRSVGLRLLAGILMCSGGLSCPATEAAPRGPEIRISDVQLFYRVYDAAGGAPSAEVLQRDYLDAGTDGVRQFIPDRIISADALARRIAKDRAPYDKARSCMAVLPDVQRRLTTILPKLGQLLPDAQFPPVTILIGRNNSGGTTKKAGVLIGLEKICSADWLEADVSDRLVHLISHEYIHIQQPVTQGDEDSVVKHPLLVSTLMEGVADFGGELISGKVANVQLQQWLAGCDNRIAVDFRREMDGTDVSHWLYNGVGTPERPGDIGYWVGYRIAKQYYARAADKTRAVQELVRLDDAKAILAASGWGVPENGRAAPTHDTCRLGADYFPEKDKPDQ